MAKKSLIAKNNHKIAIVKKFSDKRQKLKKMIYNKDISLKERFSLLQSLNSMPKNSSKVRVRNLCFLTGRSRGVFRKFGISRHKIRDLSCKMLVPGLTKSSW